MIQLYYIMIIFLQLFVDITFSFSFVLKTSCMLRNSGKMIERYPLWSQNHFFHQSKNARDRSIVFILYSNTRSKNESSLSSTTIQNTNPSTGRKWNTKSSPFGKASIGKGKRKNNTTSMLEDNIQYTTLSSTGYESNNILASEQLINIDKLTNSESMTGNKPNKIYDTSVSIPSNHDNNNNNCTIAVSNTSNFTSIPKDSRSYTTENNENHYQNANDIQNHMMQKRDEALIALKTEINLPLNISLSLLNTYPQLYKELPSLSTKLQYLLKDINLKPKQLRYMITSHPKLMTKVLMDDCETIQNTIQVIQNELELSYDDIQTIQQSKKFLYPTTVLSSYPRSELRKRILVYKLDLGYTTKQIQKLVYRDPRMLQHVTSSNIKKLLQLLYDELEMNKNDVRCMIDKEILVLTYNAEENIKRTIHYLKYGEIGESLGLVEYERTKKKLTKNDQNQNDSILLELPSKEYIIQQRIKNMVMQHPKILSSSIEKNLKPTVHFFQNTIGLSPYDFGRVLYRRGGILLESNVDRTLSKKVSFLRSTLDLEVNEDDIKQRNDHKDKTTDQITSHKMLPRPIKESSTTKSRVTKSNNKSTQCELSSNEKKILFAQMIATNPDILTFSIESNLLPKFEYFSNFIGLSKEEIRYMLLKRPQILSLSLERNIIPKIACFLKSQKGQTIMDGNSGIVQEDEDNNEYGLGLSKEEIREWIVEYPQLLTFPLDTRIKARIRDVILKLDEKGNQSDLVLGKNIPRKFIMLSDRSWESWIQDDV